MATVRVNTVYPNIENCELDPVFEEAFAYELSALLNNRCEYVDTDILVNYFPERLKNNFEVAAEKEGAYLHKGLAEYIKSLSNTFLNENSISNSM